MPRGRATCAQRGSPRILRRAYTLTAVVSAVHWLTSRLVIGWLAKYKMAGLNG